MNFPSEPVDSIITRFYAQPGRRGGDRSGRLWWVCPFHDDRNPSLCVNPGESRYHCFGCGAHGDAIDFVRRLNPGMSFSEAVRTIGGQMLESPAREQRSMKPAPVREPAVRPEGWQEFAQEVVAKAESVLWSDLGAEARSYLSGRGLHEEAIRKVHLGFLPEDERIEGLFPDSEIWVPRGIIIPWFDGPRVELINVRRPEGEPKYIAVRGSRRGGMYPGRIKIPTGKPVVIVEGEFDALLLTQELGDLAPVVTLGSASSRPTARVKNTMLGAIQWIIASDADAAGEKSADGWLSRSDRCVRVAPPKEFGKDWTEAHQNGLDLKEWWARTFEKLDRKPSFPSESETRRPMIPPEPIESLPEDPCRVDGVIALEPTSCRGMSPWPGGRTNGVCDGAAWPTPIRPLGCPGRRRRHGPLPRSQPSGKKPATPLRQ